MYKVVVTDLDGTLLNKKGTVSDYTKSVITEIVNRGIKFYIATGRNYMGAKEVMDKIELNIPLITSNGTRITDHKGNELYVNNLKRRYLNKVLKIDFKKIDKDIVLNGYSGGQWCVIENIEKRIKKLGYELLERPNIFSFKDFKRKDFNKLFYFGEYENLVKLEKLIKRLTNDEINVVFVNEGCLELYSKDCNKARGVEVLLKREGLSLDDVVAFGDGFNDYELLRDAKKGYIMGNALHRLVEALPDYEMILTSDEDGEAKKLAEIFLEK